MHRLLPIGARSAWWSPKLTPWLVRLFSPLRRTIQRRVHQIDRIDVQGLQHLGDAVETGLGVLIVANHVTYPDPLALAEAADRIGRPFHCMTAWQVFGTSGWFKRELLRRCGCFSVDREGVDRRSFRTAVAILQTSPYPLLIFPEGEMYHVNDRIMPFHDGAAAILMSAARRSDRRVTCVPAAIRYTYVEDPTPKLLCLLDRLEEAFFWRPRPDLAMPERIYRLAGAALALKEMEHLGRASAGDLPERIRVLREAILDRLEQRHDLDSGEKSVPHRVKVLRQKALERLHDADTDDLRQSIADDLEDVFLVVQLLSYPGDYLREQPSIERIAETLDKLEEDILRVPLATCRGTRRITLTFGEGIPVESVPRTQPPVSELTRTLERRVQLLLDTAPIGDQSC